jgi:hypothetical protein
MALVLNCDQCGLPIDPAESYCTGNMVEVQPPGTADPMNSPQPIRMDWHMNHIPGAIEATLPASPTRPTVTPQ